MIALGKARWVQVLIGENHWKDAVVSQLETGDIFRLAEPNGSLARDGRVYVVRAAPYVVAQEWPDGDGAPLITFGAAPGKTP